ncbi:DUF3857 domain-containing transglutaminase family protein [Paraburkholderia solisilvae]|uniref:Transglutaminase-like domain-containing protein n=1 Tax=Paraburkholderia solisilvae TaxID=624376 RepID=A0A6J5EJU6_9BURK|nr:DUF3857 and transglutaminase domain-containing protein [Paraburkholderia solisilvae]CAB3766014.1 hypothetical protein LMG29739_04706 [Paraburkholderia solisilvae]
MRPLVLAFMAACVWAAGVSNAGAAAPRAWAASSSDSDGPRAGISADNRIANDPARRSAVGSSNPAEPYTNEQETQTFTVNADGSYTKLDDITLRVNTEAGVARVAQHYIWFNRNMASVDVFDAYTVGADGVRHDVRPEQIHDVQEARSFDAPTFQDILEKVIVFPAVEPGALIHLKYRKTQRVPIVPGYFSDFTPPDLAPTHHFRLIYDLPADMPLYADARGFTAVPPVSYGQGETRRTRYEFRYDKARFGRLEYGSISYISYGDRLMVSTFRDYAAFAATYEASAADPSASDPAIVRLARTLTEADSAPHDKAKTLYDWVRKNIRYVAVNIGRGAVVPHHAADILALRYGDCKDHVALYGALLDAVGIRNEPALINSGTVYSLPSVPGFGVLNHVITWLPDLQQYADSTAPNVEFGYLPSTDMDRPTVLVEQRVLGHTPATATTARHSDLTITVAPDGSASFVYRLQATGWGAEQGRAMLRLQTPAQREEAIQGELRAANLSGNATLSTNALDASDGPLVVTMKGSLDDFVLPGAAASIPALTSFVGGFQSDARYWLGERQRTQPFVCRNVELHERARIVLPANFSVLDMPVAAQAEDRFIDFHSTYRYDPQANAITITRDGNTRFSREVCSPDEFAQMRAGIETIGRDVRAQVIVKSTLAGARNADQGVGAGNSSLPDGAPPAARKVIAEGP